MTGLFGTKVLKKSAAPAKKAAPAPKKAAPAKAPAKSLFKKAAPKPAPKAAPKPAPKARKAVATGTARTGGVGYRKFEGRPTWIPNADIPSYLDGSLPGDRGFDPLGLSAPKEYLQIEIDELDQNAAKNFQGGVIGSFVAQPDAVTEGSLSPYSEVFGLNRFRECELIHGRWAMLATLGVVIAEGQTGVAWQDAGKVELDGLNYLGAPFPWDLRTVCILEALLVGGAEVYRNGERDLEKRIYPGGAFDPLSLGSGPKAGQLREAEIKHGRLAMVAFFGFGAQALWNGTGALDSLTQFGDTF